MKGDLRRNKRFIDFLISTVTSGIKKSVSYGTVHASSARRFDLESHQNPELGSYKDTLILDYEYALKNPVVKAYESREGTVVVGLDLSSIRCSAIISAKQIPGYVYDYLDSVGKLRVWNQEIYNFTNDDGSDFTISVYEIIHILKTSGADREVSEFINRFNAGGYSIRLIDCLFSKPYDKGILPIFDIDFDDGTMVYYAVNSSQKYPKSPYSGVLSLDDDLHYQEGADLVKRCFSSDLDIALNMVELQIPGSKSIRFILEK